MGLVCGAAAVETKSRGIPVGPLGSPPRRLSLFGRPECQSALGSALVWRTKIPRLRQLFPEAEMNEFVNWRGRYVGGMIVLDRDQYSEEDRERVQQSYPQTQVVFSP